tara:strand:+ start:4894 stop:5664 length:771 start_codon:yes stop_codon:yes gene_type:complete
VVSLVITAAGLGSRFHDVGYDQPKYLLPWVTNKEVLHEIVNSLYHQGGIDFILLVMNKRELYFKEKIVQCIDEGINSKIIFIGDTNGQSQTTYIAASELVKLGLSKKPFLVHNSDTILKNRDISILSNYPKNEPTLMGIVDTFQSNNSNYSYILEKEGRLQSFLEKSVVSPKASSGLISFKSPLDFLEIYNIFNSNQSENDNNSEAYLSKLINTIISDNFSFGVNHNDETNKTIVLGTPEEYCRGYTLNATGILGP